MSITATHTMSHVSPAPVDTFRSQCITRKDLDLSDLSILSSDDKSEENPDVADAKENKINIFNSGSENMDEACKDLASARKFVWEVGKLAKKYDANYFIVTDGASGISNSGNKAVKHARDEHIKWEKNHGEDPDEDWSHTMDESLDLPENIFEAVSSPAFSVKYTPDANRPTDTTKLHDSDVTNGPILGDAPDREPDVLDADDVPDEEVKNYIPSEVVDYYNEAALKAKTRNALPDEVFGLPRTRQYPLHDKKHVMLAIKMFGHCKDPKDQKTLAANIFKAVDKFNMSPKIGKNNPLYEYAPKNLQESTSIPKLSIGGLETPMHSRSRDDIIKEHMRKNGLYYNNMFYGPEFYQSMAKVPELTFLDFFYPNLTQMNFFTRLHYICGGLGLSDEVYQQLKVRLPLATDNSEIGWFTPEEFDEVWFIIESTYDGKMNWFNDNKLADPDHIKYCLRLYSIMGKLLLDPTFDINMLDEKQFAVLTDWEQHVQYHYDLYKNATTQDEELVEMQYLFDLFWNFNDNPQDYNVRNAMTIGLLNNMVSVTNFVPSMNEASVKSKLDKDFEPKDRIQLSSLKKVHITEAVINKYKKEYPDLKHVRCKDTKEYICDGYMWFDKNKLVCCVGSCEYTDDHTRWIVSLDVLPKYRGHGLSEQILDFAVKSMKCNYLSVAKTNDIAKHVYDKYGFKVYHEDNRMYYMQLKPDKINEANNSGEIVSKEECSAYMVYEMGYADDVFLLPVTLEYPIIDQTSVRLAMDMINRIPDDQLKEYTTNLNRKYKELGCKFSISVDHPYAKYADKNIVSNMICILLEGDTPVDDQGTSTDIKANQVDDPWYKRVDYTGAVGQNILDNKEMGPNDKPQQKPEYTEYDSFR